MIRIVLVEPQLAGNIGSAARAMKTMGLTGLDLVAPRQWPHPDAAMMAAGADDLLAAARVFPDLDSAIADAHLVVGLSARRRQLSCPLQTPREAAPSLVAESDRRDVAVLFGRERTGLTNAEVERCHRLIQIPANPVYPSLNLAASVQVMTYELRLAALERQDAVVEAPPPAATAGDMERFFQHLENVLIDLDFLNRDNPRVLMRRLRVLFGRARPDDNEYNILRGILAHVDRAVAEGRQPSTVPGGSDVRQHP